MLHQIARSRQEYSVQIVPKVSDKYHAQFLPDDWDQSILANDVLPQDKDAFVRYRYRRDATNWVLADVAVQGIANWLSKNSSPHWRPNWQVDSASAHIFHSVRPSCVLR